MFDFEICDLVIESHSVNCTQLTLNSIVEQIGVVGSALGVDR